MKIQFYESPACLILETEYEDMLCSSGIDGDFIHDGIVGDDDDIFNNEFLETL